MVESSLFGMYKNRAQDPDRPRAAVLPSPAYRMIILLVFNATLGGLLGGPKIKIFGNPLSWSAAGQLLVTCHEVIPNAKGPR